MKLSKVVFHNGIFYQGFVDSGNMKMPIFSASRKKRKSRYSFVCVYVGYFPIKTDVVAVRYLTIRFLSAAVKGLMSSNQTV